MTTSSLAAILVFVTSLTAQSVLAAGEKAEECFDALLKGNLDSTTYTITTEEMPGLLDFSNNILEPKTATQIVMEIGRRAQCEKDVLTFSVPDCKTPYPHRPEINVCLVESTAGYFLVSQDYLNTYHAIFVRWD